MFRLHCHPDLAEAPGPEALARLRTVALRCLLRHPVGGVVDAVLAADDEVRRLNRTFRARDETTDVLSFSFRDGGDIGAQPVVVDAGDPDREEPAGEVYISVPRAALQARDLDVGLDAELARLLVHGLLHLAGYDHQTEAQLQTMERETEDLLQAPTY